MMTSAKTRGNVHCLGDEAASIDRDADVGRKAYTYVILV